MMTHLTRYSGIVCAIVCLIGGCNGGKKSKIIVVRYPEFYTPELKRVAVLKFGNQTNVASVEERMRDKVEAALINNKTYEVYTREHLKDVLKEQDLVLAGMVDSDTAMRIGKLASAQALICGACNQYGSGTKSEMRSREVGVYGRMSNGKWGRIGTRTENYVWTRNEAVVENGVTVIDTATGQQIAAFNQPSLLWSEGSPPRHNQYGLLQLAELDQLNKILLSVAVVKTTVKLKGTPLRIATGQYDGKWDWQNRIIPSDEKFHAVVKLPPEAGRNNFKLTIVPKDQRVNIAEQEFVWPEQSSENSYVFDVEPIVDKNGLGAYQVKLYSGPEPVAWYDFQIAEKR